MTAATVTLPPEVAAALAVGALALIASLVGTAKAWLTAIAAKAAAVEAQAQAEAAKAKAETARVQADTANDRVSNVAKAQDTIRSDLTAVALNTPAPSPTPTTPAQ